MYGYGIGNTPSKTVFFFSGIVTMPLYDAQLLQSLMGKRRRGGSKAICPELVPAKLHKVLDPGQMVFFSFPNAPSVLSLQNLCCCLNCEPVLYQSLTLHLFVSSTQT